MSRSALLLFGLLAAVPAAAPAAPRQATSLPLQVGEFVTVRIDGTTFEVVNREKGQPDKFLSEAGVRFSLSANDEIPLLMVENAYRDSLVYYVRSIPGGPSERNCAVRRAAKFQPLGSSVRRIEISGLNLAPPGPKSCFIP